MKANFTLPKAKENLFVQWEGVCSKMRKGNPILDIIKVNFHYIDWSM